MAGLPDGVRSVRLTPMNQFESVAVRLASLVREGIGGQRGDDAIDDPIARRLFAQILRQPPVLAAGRCNRQWRFLKRDAFDGILQPR